MHAIVLGVLILQERVSQSLRVAAAWAEDRLRKRSRDAEVTDLDFEVLVHKNICGLDISVYDAGRVQKFEPTKYLIYNFDNLVSGKFVQVLRNQRSQIILEVLTDHEHPQFIIFRFLTHEQIEELRGVPRAGGRGVQRFHQLNFAQYLQTIVLVLAEIADHLYRDRLIIPEASGFEDGPKCTLTDE